MMDRFEMLNRRTQEFRNTNVDRFNPSTRGNYRYFDTDYYNNQTYRSNNGSYSNYYTKSNKYN